MNKLMTFFISSIIVLIICITLAHADEFDEFENNNRIKVIENYISKRGIKFIIIKDCETGTEYLITILHEKQIQVTKLEQTLTALLNDPVVYNLGGKK